MSAWVRATVAGALAWCLAGGAAAAPGVAPPNSCSAGAAAPWVKRFALVVGSNRPTKAGLATLRYADDDAVRWAILFRTYGADVELLTDLDQESATLYGADAPPHRSPTRAAVVEATARLRREIDRARADGAHTAFYFVYAGHGDEENGEGFIGVADGRLSRREIEEQVLAVPGADTNHVIIDACRSFYIAYDRGPGGSRRQWLEPYFSTGPAARSRNTGFVLASSSGGATHEWEEFQAGIFSHEVRSGLLGGADANGDGLITYAELSAFVRVANQAVRNDKYRPDILARAPANGDDVLIDLRDAVAGRVRLGADLTGRQVLEDALGIRWADVHPGPRQRLTLALPAEPWGDRVLFVESLAEKIEYRVNQGEVVDLAQLASQPRQLSSRGPLNEAFALLFALPFDITALTAPSEPDVSPPPAAGLKLRMGASAEPAKVRSKWALALGSAAVAALGAAGGLAWSAAALRQDAQSRDGADRAALNQEVSRRNEWVIGLASTGAVLAATAGALLVWDRWSRE